jgi:hypothetical protein
MFDSSIEVTIRRRSWEALEAWSWGCEDDEAALGRFVIDATPEAINAYYVRDVEWHAISGDSTGGREWGSRSLSTTKAITEKAADLASDPPPLAVRYRIDNETPSEAALTAVAAFVRFSDLAIRVLPAFAFAMLFSVRTSSFVQARRVFVFLANTSLRSYFGGAAL